ncbi:DUF4160 domain-containing protein [Rhodopseudomonas telluris]|uniref:DUF4160 domain-containing protein n=1 Tax=Rhodopseudomonas telluris TaxID=644215 RepID=A0ABV6EMJ6_9BRAD
MPTILRWGAYRAFFYSNESGEPPHLHVRRGDCEAKFWLHDLSLAVNAGFPAHEIGAIVRYLRPRLGELEGKWHEHFGN